MCNFSSANTVPSSRRRAGARVMLVCSLAAENKMYYNNMYQRQLDLIKRRSFANNVVLFRIRKSPTNEQWTYHHNSSLVTLINSQLTRVWLDAELRAHRWSACKPTKLNNVFIRFLSTQVRVSVKVRVFDSPILTCSIANNWQYVFNNKIGVWIEPTIAETLSFRVSL